MKRISGFAQFLFRLPLGLYRLRLGWLFGSRFLRLTHIGRKSGRSYQTIIEVIGYDKATDTYTVVSGFGPQADWYRNIQHAPDVVITVGRRITPAQAECLSKLASAQALRAYARRYPVASRVLSRLLLGGTLDLSDENLESLGEKMPAVAFHCL